MPAAPRTAAPAPESAGPNFSAIAAPVVRRGRPGPVGVTAKDNRRFVEAVLYRYRAGIPWRDLPERFGDFRVIHLRHTRWSRSGVWQRVFEALAEDADNEYAMIDSDLPPLSRTK